MKHGGDIYSAARQWSIPEERWLDLSTAISPYSYPLPAPPQEIWQRLPYINEALIHVAKQYYQCESLLPVAGTQQAIEILPQILPGEVVALPRIGYSEHEIHWRLSGREIKHYDNAEDLNSMIAQNNIDIAVVINPNNPTGHSFERESLGAMSAALTQNQGYLVVDEAFMDTRADNSLALSLPKNAIVLRSMGKFFGLAGIRMGFVIADEVVLEKIGERTGLWRISGPTQWAALQALQDCSWHKDQIQRLENNSKELLLKLTQYLPLVSARRQSMFVSVTLAEQHAHAIFQMFAEAAVLLRQFELPNGQGLLRFGLLPSDKQSRERFYTLLDAAAKNLGHIQGVRTDPRPAFRTADSLTSD